MPKMVKLIKVNKRDKFSFEAIAKIQNLEEHQQGLEKDCFLEERFPVSLRTKFHVKKFHHENSYQITGSS
jgi:hypothetical protein